MKKNLKISIIIPLYVIEDRFFEDLKKFDKLDYPDYEVIIVSDKPVEIRNTKAKLLLTGEKKTGPAEKRDMALKIAKGEICAFIDDDAYPDSKWLSNAATEFNDPNIAAVGGPGLTPPEDDFWSQMTGLVYSSFFCGGFAQYRFVKGKRRLVVDYPAYNLLIRTDILKKVGGYGSYFYGGEDTFLCLKLIKDGHKILYSPNVVVYHHRRALFLPYLRQISNVGKHRGYFAKRFPETSRTVGYFIPTVLTLGFLLCLALSLYSLFIAKLFLISLLLFLLIGTVSVLASANIFKAMLVSVAIILTHLTYGYYFMVGLFLSKLDR
jgi:GT2 family glycosyltransferase